MNRTKEELTNKYIEFEKMFPPFLRDEVNHMCVDEIAEGWEWCFDPSQCYVLEKLDGTNVKFEVNNLELNIFARNQKSKGYVLSELNNPDYKYINQGVLNTVANKKKRFKSGVYYGELLGPSIQGNPYSLTEHGWYNFEPFKGGVEVYKDYPKNSNFEDWKNWILSLKSLLNPEVESEGIIFLNKLDGRMSKLRKDMFSKSYKH